MLDRIWSHLYLYSPKGSCCLTSSLYQCEVTWKAAQSENLVSNTVICFPELRRSVSVKDCSGSKQHCAFCDTSRKKWILNGLLCSRWCTNFSYGFIICHLGFSSFTSASLWLASLIKSLNNKSDFTWLAAHDLFFIESSCRKNMTPDTQDFLAHTFLNCSLNITVI